MKQYFEGLSENHYIEGMKFLQDFRNKGIQIEGDYIE